LMGARFWRYDNTEGVRFVPNKRGGGLVKVPRGQIFVGTI